MICNKIKLYNTDVTRKNQTFKILAAKNQPSTNPTKNRTQLNQIKTLLTANTVTFFKYHGNKIRVYSSTITH